MFERHAKSRVHELLNEFRVVYIAGPRQSGKTTLAKLVAQERGMAYLSLDNPSALASARSDPVGFIESFAMQNLVIDEFQYVPELVGAVKLASDALPLGQRGHFLLTGSADIFSSAKVLEALPGHMARLTLYPLSLAERSSLAPTVNLIDYLCDESAFYEVSSQATTREKLANWILQGGYPEVHDKSQRSKAAWYRSYVQGRLFKDFESLYAARGEYRDKLKSLIPYLAGINAQLLKYASVANDLGQNDKVVKSYVEALEWMYIIKRIPAFIKNSAKRETLAMPKLHMVDTGLACHLLGINTPGQLLESASLGPMLENFVLMELFKHAAWANRDINVMHFRDMKKSEVDIVLEMDNADLIGIEVKASSTVSEKDFSGLQAFADFVGNRLRRGVLFYTGQRVLPFKRGTHQFYALPIGSLMTSSLTTSSLTAQNSA
jgi:uncharacterized protein